MLPAITLATIPLATISRLTRSSLLNTLGEYHVRVARAKGLPYRTVVLRHGLRNSLIPIVTIVGVQFGTLLGGAVIVETVFAWPGIGRLLVDAVNDRDFPLVQGIVLFVAICFVFVNLIVDLLYAALDPRVRYGEMAAVEDVVGGRGRLALQWRVFRSALFWRKLRRFLRHKSGVTGLIIVLTVAAAALLAPAIAPYDPSELTPDVLAGPTRDHLFGTDDLGRDVFSRVLYGARISPLVGVAAMALAASIGTILGLIAGYLGGITDAGVMRSWDMLLAFPGIILAIVVVAVLGPGSATA